MPLGLGKAYFCHTPVSKDEAHNSEFQFIFPENVVATVVEALGIERRQFTSLAEPIKALPALIKDP